MWEERRSLTQDHGDIEALIARLDTVCGCEDVSVSEESPSTLETLLSDPDLQPGGPGELIPPRLALHQAGLLPSAGSDLATVAVQEIPELGRRRPYNTGQGRDLQKEENIWLHVKFS